MLGKDGHATCEAYYPKCEMISGNRHLARGAEVRQAGWNLRDIMVCVWTVFL